LRAGTPWRSSRRRERAVAAHGCAVFALFERMAVGGGLIAERHGEGTSGRKLEQAHQRDRPSEPLPEANADLNQDERVGAKVEEVVVDAGRRDAKKL